jgi:hypothetical protein
MNREDIQKLLGGYATGTLTPEEQQALFSAALEDQELFDALAREQSLRELLEDPRARAQLLAALDERPERWYARWWRPAALALATASVAVLAVVAIRQNTRPAPTASVSTMAEVKRPAPPVPTREADQAKPAPTATPSANAIRAKRQLALPEQDVKEKAVAPVLPEPPIRETRPAGVAGGVTGGVPATAPAAPPALQTDTLAKDQVMARGGGFSATSGNQRARMMFFGPPQSSGFLDAQNAPVANAQAEAATGARDEKKQAQKAAEQARTMLRSTTSALATRAM